MRGKLEQKHDWNRRSIVNLGNDSTYHSDSLNTNDDCDMYIGNGRYHFSGRHRCFGTHHKFS